MMFSFENTARRFPWVSGLVIMWEVGDKTTYRSRSILPVFVWCYKRYSPLRCVFFDGKLGVPECSSPLRFDVGIVGMETPMVGSVHSHISYHMARCEKTAANLHV